MLFSFHFKQYKKAILLIIVLIYRETMPLPPTPILGRWMYLHCSQSTRTVQSPCLFQQTSLFHPLRRFLSPSANKTILYITTSTFDKALYVEKNRMKMSFIQNILLKLLDYSTVPQGYIYFLKKEKKYAIIFY